MIYSVRCFLSTQPSGPCPQPVGDGEQEERQHIPHHYLEDFGCGGVTLHLPDGSRCQRLSQLLLSRQVVAAPFPVDHAVLEEHQSRIASDDGLERCLVGLAEQILGTRILFPSGHLFFAAGGETIEGHPLLLSILIDEVDKVEPAVISLAQMGCDEQEGISGPVQHIERDILSILHGTDGEIMDGRLISLFGLYGLAVHESPGRVGIVVYRELLLHAVLCQDEGGFKLGLRSSLGYGHCLGDMHAHMIGTKVEERQEIESVARHGQDKHR